MGHESLLQQLQTQLSSSLSLLASFQLSPWKNSCPLKENGLGHLSVHLRQVQVQVGKTVRHLDFLRKEVAIQRFGQADWIPH